jgi:hypothetical protein
MMKLNLSPKLAEKLVWVLVILFCKLFRSQLHAWCPIIPKLAVLAPLSCDLTYNFPMWTNTCQSSFFENFMKHFILFYFWEFHFLFKVLLMCLNFELDLVCTIEEVVFLLGDTCEVHLLRTSCNIFYL